MFKAIGFMIALYAVTQLMGSTFIALEKAAVASLQTVETAAEISRIQLIKTQNE